MRLRIEGKEEDVLEFSMEIQSHGCLDIYSKKGNLKLREFTVYPDGTWYKVSNGHLKDSQ